MDASLPFNPKEILCPVDMSTLSDLSLKASFISSSYNCFSFLDSFFGISTFIFT